MCVDRNEIERKARCGFAALAGLIRMAQEAQKVWLKRLKCSFKCGSRIEYSTLAQDYSDWFKMFKIQQSNEFHDYRLKCRPRICYSRHELFRLKQGFGSRCSTRGMNLVSSWLSEYYYNTCSRDVCASTHAQTFVLESIDDRA